MPKSPYFKDVPNEQNLLENLTVETIRAMGRDVYYIPRTLSGDEDKIFGEDTSATFKTAHLIEMYHEDATAFGGEGDIVGKFGIDVKDRAIFRVARRTFNELVTKVVADVCRPKEGDLIYYPLSGSLFEITFVEHESPLYQLGDLYSYVLYVETFAYNNETFSAGVCDIDGCFVNLMSDRVSCSDSLGEQTCIQTNPVENGAEMGDNLEIEDEADDFVDFSETDPFSGGQY